MSLEERLAKIKSPNLQNQKHTVVVLSSIEETLREQNTLFTPTAYFAALLALLKQTAGSVQNDSNELVSSTVYLLDIVTSHVPPALLRSQFTTIFSLLTPWIDLGTTNAPLLRSVIGVLESILLVQDSTAWNQAQSHTSPRQGITILLSLATDARPKIRKRAHEAIITILQNPPPGPSIDHPATELCATAVQDNLKSAVDSIHQARKQKGIPDDSHDPPLVHALQLTKAVAKASNGWSSRNIEQVCEMLLSISRSRNEYLVMSAFEVFEVVFESMQDEASSAKLPRLLDAIIELKPAQNDSQLVPPWIAILSRGYGALAEIEPEDVFTNLPDLFELAASFLTSSSHNIRLSASECLISFFANCIPDSAILEPSVYDEKVLQQIADKALGLLTVKFQTAWIEIFGVIAALINALKWRGNPFLLPIVDSIGRLRGSEAFQGKKEADEVLGHAIRNLGPRAVLDILPHNLIKPQPGHPGRAWLLPLLRDHVSNSDLQHFKDTLIPLSESMYQRVMDHSGTEKTMDIKVFETVVQQIWATLPGYCDLPLDLRIAMDQPFAELISSILYKQPDLRVDLCRGLQNLVESNQAVVASDVADHVLLVERRMTRDDAEKNITHLASFASNFLAVLFNVYSQTLPQSRAHILQCINAYLSITPEQDLVATFERVGAMFEKALPSRDEVPSKKEQSHQTKQSTPPTSHTLVDLIIALSVYLPRSSFSTLFALANNILTNSSIVTSDPQLIKKAYKIIPRLATSVTGAEALKVRNSELQQLILATADKTPIPARRDRLVAIDTLLAFLPPSQLHFIPSIMGEVILACKDTNEKARAAGFETLLSAADRIASTENPAGTVIHNRLVPHMPGDAPDAIASLEEVFTMVSAGLAGVAPHMVAASITALSRLLFEYHSSSLLSQKMKEELVDTVTMFLQSNNREIVRAVLGFIKVMVVVLPIPVLEGRMGTIIPGLMTWSKENKGRLRIKVKGILERLMRRFGAAKVEDWVGDDDRKMVTNIRKRRERAKRKKSDVTEDFEEEIEKNKQTTFDEAFDEAIYGSDADDDSEIMSSDNEDAMSGVSFKSKQTAQSTRKNREVGAHQFIRSTEDDDEPLDLLDPRSMASISSSRRPLHSTRILDSHKKQTKAKFNEDGKLIFDNKDAFTKARRGSSARHDNEADEAAQGDAINAYLDAVDGADAVRRGQKGRLKMKSGMQKAARRDDTNDGGEMDLDVEEAREVARKIMAGSGSPKTAGTVRNNKKPQDQRRGLGVEKRRGTPTNIGKRLDRNGRGGKTMKKGVRFSRHPRR